jgi:hypothetical protein
MLMVAYLSLKQVVMLFYNSIENMDACWGNKTLLKI